MMESAGLEKTELSIGFIPILCAAPLLLAHARGIFEKHGLRVNLWRAPGWSGIKELLAYGKIDAAHMLAPMPLACNQGIDGKKSEMVLAAIQNVNGQALTLAMRHLGIVRIQDMRGFTFGVPYRFSMHYYLLCHYLAQHGVHPLKDVIIIEVAPPNMPHYLEQGRLDGYLAPEPFNQVPVTEGTGFIQVLSKEIWQGHPCCSFATTRVFRESNPKTYRAVLRSVLEAEKALHQANQDERRSIARSISDPAHLDLDDVQPAQQVLAGSFPDGKGNVRNVRDRIDFLPYPFVDYGSWMLSQMQRWGQLRRKIDYREIVESTFDSEATEVICSALGYSLDDGPSTGAIGFSGADPCEYMIQQPFSDYQPQSLEQEAREIPEVLNQRLLEINDQLAEAVGGKLDVSFRKRGDDELGLLEELLDELVRNFKFARLLLSDRNAKLRDSALLLKLREEDLRTTLASIGDGVISTDKRRRVTRLNRSAEMLTGWTEQEALGRLLDDVFRIISEKTREAAPDPVARALATGRVVGLTNHTLLVSRKGVETAIATTTAPIYDTTGSVTGVVLVFRDQSDERAAAQAQEESEEKLRSLIESSPDWIWEVNAEGVYTYVSPRITELLGYEPEEIVGKTPFDLMPPEEAERIGREFGAIVQARRPFANLVNRNRHKDGREVVLETSGVPFLDQSGELAGYRGIDRDITARSEMAESLELPGQQRSALQQSNAELEQFAYVASHDLQEPLRMVASYTQLLAERYGDKLDDQAEKYISYAVDGAKRMQDLVDDLLAFSRVGSRIEPMEPVDCAEVLSGVVHGLSKTIEDNRVEIIVDVLPTVMADRRLLSQVFQNLIDNSIKFRAAAPPRIEVGARRKGTCWELSVRDNGIGIDPKYHERVFSIFQRLHERNKYPGSGIGLSIVKKIVEGHGGDIQLESAEGNGARFTFTVPAADG